MAGVDWKSIGTVAYLQPNRAAFFIKLESSLLLVVTGIQSTHKRMQDTHVNFRPYHL